MACDGMRVRLHLHRIRVVDVVTDLPERLEVVIQDLRSVVPCPWCGFKTTKVHETRRVKINDVPRGARRSPSYGCGVASSAPTAASATRRATRRSPAR